MYVNSLLAVDCTGVLVVLYCCCFVLLLLFCYGDCSSRSDSVVNINRLLCAILHNKANRALYVNIYKHPPPPPQLRRGTYRLVTSGRYLSCFKDLKDATYNHRGGSPR